ncbi:glycosyltransferase family 2 protein [Actinoplanes sp. NPDC023714]|uniref:glycosyltransferase family 2 protein n=1 Tax=Actinoplanes sp. NPDC023714 TaxID=3154322 RepID=UPI00340538E1
MEEKPVVLLPVFRPQPSLHDLVTALLAEGFAPARIVVVDDGSGPDADTALGVLRRLGCAVLRHQVNQGKGVAIKTGLGYAVTEHPGTDVICADPDGQHHAGDIGRIAARTGRGAVVLGVRSFEDMPPRSRFGNTLTRALFRAATGHDVSDTQTGLRAFPADSIEHLRTIPGERFEYEMNVLLDAVGRGRPIEEVTIPATYLDGNAGSHFGSLTDSIRVYRPLLQYATTSRLRSTPAPRP